jgi:protein CpxP
MKKLILAFAIMVNFVSFAQERTKFKSENDVVAYIKDMTKELGLSEKQQGEFKLVMMDQFNKRKQMRENMRTQKESGEEISDEKKAEMKKARIDEQLGMRTKLKKILSEEQMKKLGEMQNEKRKAEDIDSTNDRAKNK